MRYVLYTWPGYLATIGPNPIFGERPGGKLMETIKLQIHKSVAGASMARGQVKETVKITINLLCQSRYLQ